tara:strand:- start:1026 stop:1448 length:423 start_codon:yes stop_codon:yes gene_type:complete
MAVTRVGKGKSSKNENLIRWVKEVLAASDYKSFREWSKDSNVHSHAASDIEKGLNPRAETVVALARAAGFDVIEAILAHGLLDENEIPTDLSKKERLLVSGFRRLRESQQDFVFDAVELQLKRNTDRESTALAQDTPQEA